MKKFKQKVMTNRLNSFLALLLIVFTSCSADDDSLVTGDDTLVTDDEPVIEESVKYLALGGSYTIGQGIDESERWPNQLVNELETTGYTVENSEIIAQTGWRTSSLIDAIETNDPQDFNLVSLLIGVNNQFNNQNFDIFTSEFNVIIQKAISIAGGNDGVFVVSIPDYGVTPFGASFNPQVIAEELDMYNNYMKKKCQVLDIPFINITEISRTLGDSEGLWLQIIYTLVVCSMLYG